nr:PAS domain S-box protein [Nitrospirota bacterium]
MKRLAREAHLAGILEMAEDAIISMDEHQRIRFFNHGATVIFGYSQDEVLGQPLDILLPSRLVDVHRQHVRAFAGSPEASRRMGGRREVVGRRKDGTEFPAEASISKLTVRGETVYAAILRDITQREQAKEALRDSERYNRQLFKLSPLGLALCRLDGRLVDVNDAYARILGCSAAETLNLTYWEVTPEKYVAQEQAQLESLRATGRYGPYEKEYIHKDGHLVTVRLSGVMIEQGGEKFIWSMVEDVTERKQLEEQLRQSHKMEAVGQLAGGIAHDFNNMLTVITGYSELLLKHADLNDALRGPLEEIRQAGERAGTLTNQLLAFSRQQSLQPTVLDMNPVVRDIATMLRRLIGEDIVLEVIPAQNLGLVKVDAGQIEQVLMNLAVNARDAMLQGGQLTIETANIQIDPASAASHPGMQPGPHVIVAVRDTGCGMDAETRARIFEPFFTTKEKGKGTGLGLSTVYGIVKQSGGHILVESELGRGTTFTIYLPRLEAEALTPVAPPEGQTADRGTETILIVEDETYVREVAREGLEEYGYAIKEACNGHEASLFSERHEGPIHLLLIDLVMPGGSGREVAERLLSHRPDMKVLFMSGYPDDAVARHGVLVSNTILLEKPFSPEALAQKVREVLDWPS